MTIKHRVPVVIVKTEATKSTHVRGQLAGMFEKQDGFEVTDEGNMLVVWGRPESAVPDELDVTGADFDVIYRRDSGRGQDLLADEFVALLRQAGEHEAAWYEAEEQLATLQGEQSIAARSALLKPSQALGIIQEIERSVAGIMEDYGIEDAEGVYARVGELIDDDTYSVMERRREAAKKLIEYMDGNPDQAEFARTDEAEAVVSEFAEIESTQAENAEICSRLCKQREINYLVEAGEDDRKCFMNIYAPVRFREDGEYTSTEQQVLSLIEESWEDAKELLDEEAELEKQEFEGITLYSYMQEMDHERAGRIRRKLIQGMLEKQKEKPLYKIGVRCAVTEVVHYDDSSVYLPDVTEATIPPPADSRDEATAEMQEPPAVRGQRGPAAPSYHEGGGPEDAVYGEWGDLLQQRGVKYPGTLPEFLGQDTGNRDGIAVDVALLLKVAEAGDAGISRKGAVSGARIALPLYTRVDVPPNAQIERAFQRLEQKGIVHKGLEGRYQISNCLSYRP